MNYGMGSKLEDEINPTGQSNPFDFFEKENLEMLFWVGMIYVIFYLFF